MKRFRIYRNGTFDEDSLLVLDFGSVPGDCLSAAEQEAFDISLADPIGEEESLEQVYHKHPQLCGFEPWIWRDLGGWNPQGLNREGLIMGQKIAARTELTDYVRTFIDTYHHYLTPDEIREIIEQVLADTAEHQ